jgi:hypothetical protein
MDDQFTVWPADETDPATSVVAVRGRCADFCATEGPFEDASVDDHGPWCTSRPCGREVVAQSNTGTVDITVELVAAYLHGRYRSKHYRRVAGKRYVRVRTDTRGSQVQPCFVYMESSGARQLAATLIRAADHADQLDVPLTSALQERVARALVF